MVNKGVASSDAFLYLVQTKKLGYSLSDTRLRCGAHRTSEFIMIVGTEWLIEAIDCDPGALRDEGLVRDILERVVKDLALRSVGSVWHKFPGEGGVTGLIALTESHLACHTYPESGTATFNLYCCRVRPRWDWERQLKSKLRAAVVTVTHIERGLVEPTKVTIS